MKKPYTLVCNSKRKTPYVVGHYETISAANEALKIFKKRNAVYPGHDGQGAFYRDLKIIGPT